MRIEQLGQWTSAGLDQGYLKSTWTTVGLLGFIVLSLFGVIYIKFENHRLYAQLKRLESQTHAVFRDHQMLSSEQVSHVGYEAVQRHISEHQMVVQY